LSNGAVVGADGSGGLSREATIHCTDCHNTDLFGTFLGSIPRFLGIASGNPPPFNLPDYPGPITFDDTRGTAYRRPTDRAPNIPENPDGVRASSLNDPKSPQGPHGSIYKRILRANYDTKIGTFDKALIGDVLCDTTNATCTGNARATYNPQNFALCFNCHAEAAFITPSWNDSGAGPENCSKGANGAFVPPKARLTNFYRCGTNNVDGNNNPGGNLHTLHLIGRTNARCHECHNNVHSNVEAGNTIYVGLNDPQFTRDNPGHNQDTHLLNFQPNIKGNDNAARGGNSGRANQPMWGEGSAVNPADYNAPTDGTSPHKGPGCNLRCHGFYMQHNT